MNDSNCVCGAEPTIVDCNICGGGSFLIGDGCACPEAGYFCDDCADAILGLTSETVYQPVE